MGDFVSLEHSFQKKAATRDLLPATSAVKAKAATTSRPGPDYDLGPLQMPLYLTEND